MLDSDGTHAAGAPLPCEPTTTVAAAQNTTPSSPLHRHAALNGLADRWIV